MTPYWIVFERSSKPTFFNLGVGVTASSEGEALEIVNRTFPDAPNTAGVRIVDDASELDQTHVIPNMGDMLRRGVWFPMGFD